MVVANDVVNEDGNDSGKWRVNEYGNDSGKWRSELRRRWKWQVT